MWGSWRARHRRAASGLQLRGGDLVPSRHYPRVPDSITVPGTPALVSDLIDRFRSGDRVVTEEAIHGYHVQARSARPEVEGNLTQSAVAGGGTLVGLEFAIKQLDSIRRKVRSRLMDLSALRQGTAITDALRFTAVFPVDRYAQGAQDLVWRLQDHGQTVIDEENSWAPGDSYSGLHYILQTPSGSLYELQIHTPESFVLKNGTSHRVYEEFRSPSTTEERRRELATQMAEEWSRIPIPDGALGFGGPDADRRYDV